MADSNSEVVERVRGDIEFFASDTLEGRELTPPELKPPLRGFLPNTNESAETRHADGTYRQPFTWRWAIRLCRGNSCHAEGADNTEIKLELGISFSRFVAAVKVRFPVAWFSSVTESRLKKQFDEYAG